MGVLCYCRTAAAFVVIAFSGCAIEAQTSELRQAQKDLANWYLDRDPGKTTVFVPFLSPLSIDNDIQKSSELQPNQELLMVTDPVPQSDAVVSGTNRTTYEIYEVIMRNRAPEKWILTPLQAKQLKDAEHVILKRYCFFSRLFFKLRHEEVPRVPSKGYRVYRRFSHEAAVLSDRIANERDPVTRAELQEELKTEEYDWSTKGAREKVSSAIATAIAVRSTDPERFWTDVETRYRLNTRQAGGVRLPVTRVVPEVKDWSDLRDWVAWQAGTSSGEVKFISIKRDWLVDAVFGSHKWSWGPGIYRQEKVRISDGTSTTPERVRKPLMPLMPVSVVIGKGTTLEHGGTTMREPAILGLICKILPKLPED